MNDEERREYNRIRIREWRAKNPDRAKAIAKRQTDKKKAKAAKRKKMPHKAAMRVRSGTPPSGEGWYVLDETIGSGDGSGEYWNAYIRQQERAAGWYDIKVFVDGKRKGKANFWLAWDGARLADNANTAKLKEYKPVVLDRVCCLLQDAIDRINKGNIYRA